MGRYGSADYCDEDSYGQRTVDDVRGLIRSADKMRLGEMLPASSDDVCDSDPQCVKWDKEWREQSLATKGLKSFNGTGETAEDGVSKTEGMYDGQVSGKNYGRREKW